MNHDLNSVFFINKYLTRCKHNPQQMNIARKYLKYKLEKILRKKKNKPKYYFFFGLPINLLTF